MRSSRLTVFVSAIFLPHIIAITNNLPDGIDVGQDPAWGDKNWNTDGEALQEGPLANGDGYDLAFANSPTQLTSSDSTDTSFSELAATPNECENQPKVRRLRARARRQRRNPEKPLSCPAKLEIPYRQPSGLNRQTSGESKEPNTSTQQDNTTGGKKKPTGSSPGSTPEPWLIPVPEPKWAGYNPTCFSKTYGLLPLAVCDSSPYQLPSSYDLHGEPNLEFSQPPKWEGPRHAGDIGPQPVQLGLDLNNPKSWQLNYAWLAHPLATSCEAGIGNSKFWCCKKFERPVQERPGKADICLTLDMIDRMEANGEFKNEMHPLILPP